MVEFLSQLLNGLAVGNVYALIALGFTLVFGVARLINFAQGSLFMLGAYLAFTGVTFLGLPLIVAAILAIAGTTVFGILVERIGVRPLERGPMLAPFLSTLALAIIVDELARVIWGADPRPFPNPFAGPVLHLGNAFVTVIDLIVLIVAVATMIALSLFLSRTWAGRAMRAAAQDLDAAQQVGVNVGKSRQMAFGLAAALGAVAGVLVGMYYTIIFPTMGLPYAIKGFSAALLGGLASVPGAIVGGYVLGVLESLASGYVGQGLRDVVAYGFVLLVLTIRPEGLLGSTQLQALGGVGGASGLLPGTSLLSTPSGASITSSRRLNPRPLVLLAVLALALLLPFVASAYVLQVATLAAVYAIVAIGLTIVSGTAGQISLAHAGLFGVGAYTTAILAKSHGWPAEATIVSAAAFTALVAVIAAIPSIRLSGHAVALTSLAIGVIAYLTFLSWIEVTRGPFGITGIPPAKFALGLSVITLDAKFRMAIGVLLFAVWFATRVLRSPVGRVWRSIREDRLAAEAAGVPVGRYLLMAHGTGGLLAGLAGSAFAYQSSFVSPESFSLNTAILLLTIVILGGIGNVTGALLGAAAMIGAFEALRLSIDYRVVLVSLLLLVALRFRPQGLAGAE